MKVTVSEEFYGLTIIDKLASFLSISSHAFVYCFGDVLDLTLTHIIVFITSVLYYFVESLIL